MDKFKEECGVFGIVNDPNAAYFSYLGLYSLQHRGQESAGIATFSNDKLYSWKGMGLVAEVFKKYDFNNLPGQIAIAHNRYSTTGSSSLSNAQPLCMECRQGMFAIAHNGNLVNAQELRKKLQNEGAIFQTSSDSEVIIHLMSRAKNNELQHILKQALSKLTGAYCIVAMAKDRLVAARDPYGFRPLSLGKTAAGGYCVASETCAFDLIGAEYIRDIKPGEILTIKDNKLTSSYLPKAPRTAKCVFEFIYFSRPDSMIFGSNCDKIRREMGRALAREDHFKEADLVMSVPDSSNTAALGYSQESGIPFDFGLIRNHYVGRTFIKPSQGDRELSVRLKFNPVKGVIRNKRILLVDDSIVRGTTLKRLIKFLKTNGAREIHVRIASPVISAPCFFGIDLSTKNEIIGANKNIEEIRDFIGSESLKYLSIKGMLKCVPGTCRDYCVGCFGAGYPIKPPKRVSKLSLEQRICIKRNKFLS